MGRGRVAMALFGLLPRLTSLSWGVLVGACCSANSARSSSSRNGRSNLSPFSHIPRLPTAEFDDRHRLVVFLTAIAMVSDRGRPARLPAS